MEKVIQKEIRVVGSRSQKPADWEPSLQLMAVWFRCSKLRRQKYMIFRNGRGVSTFKLLGIKVLTQAVYLDERKERINMEKINAQL
ncbi:hypothetical protein ACVNPX_09190 [Staphylococcus aureus]